MKIKLIPTLAFVLAMSLFTSCSKDDSTSHQLESMKPVAFAKVQDEVISSEPTGKVIGNKKEYRQVIKKQITLDPIELVDESLSDIIYPGCILRGDAFMEGEYSPISIKNPQTITLSATVRGKTLPEKKEVLPTLHNVRQGIDELMEPNARDIRKYNTASYITYITNDVTTKESFNKTFNTHIKTNRLNDIINANFIYEAQKISSSGKHYVLIKIKQKLFNISMDAKHPDEWGELGKLGEYEPLYVSSVDYGRVVHLLIETTESTEAVSKMIKEGIKTAFTNYGSSLEAEYEKQWSRYFKEGKIQVMVSGGPMEYARKIRDYDSFMMFIDIPSSKSLIKSSVPISYRVRSVRTNREIEVRNFYTEEVLVTEK
ncbi:thiol-activated cytolysin family protein [Prevotella sp. HUN102]|uniref:thiol-activated cytolysin family protein n=1 Tax=Prevotella sp. HUN102 TaxID=1392486 RepID=UPI001E5138B5|nr:thiol-activated cytolysin family protein [Prevotella sp. HUN102]